MSTSLFDVTGAKVIITGGLSGLGRAVAESFVEQGAHVTVIDVSVSGTEYDHPGSLRGARLVHADVASPHIGDVIRDEIDRLGGLDVLFANAGISGGSDGGEHDVAGIETTDWDLWDHVHAVNLRGAARTVAAAAATFKAQRSGHVVITSSIAGLRANSNIALSYQSSKAAVAAVVRGLAVELAPFGVTVNGIAPGPFATGIGGGWLATEEGAELAARVVPLGRVAQPREVVGLVQMLSSDAASFITGAMIPVDGGATAGVAG